MKKQEILYNLNAVLRDVYHISNLEDMIALPSTKPENGGEISIKYDRGKSTMVLSSTKRDVLLAVSHIYIHTHIQIYTYNQLIASSS